MPPAPPDEQDTPDDAAPSTPRKTDPTKNNDGEKPPTAPVARKAGGTATPRIAPTASAARQRSSSSRRPNEPPSLLTDFLLGRPSPQRIAAQRQRRQSLDAVKTEMRQAAVRKLEQPGGVRDRVKQWQKKNAAAISQGDPAATPSEPTDIASFRGEIESVTEEDRVRIKLRQKKRPPAKPIVHQNNKGSNEEEANKKNEPNEDGETGEKEGSANIPSDAAPIRPRSRGPPKRVVSDTNWMAKKNKKNSNSNSNSSKSPLRYQKDTSTGPKPIPKDFLQRTAVNPPVSKKVQEWAAKVETPEPSRTAMRRKTKSKDMGDGIRVKPVNSPRDDSSVSTSRTSLVRDTLADQDTRVERGRSKGRDDDGIRVKPIDRRSANDDGIRVKPIDHRSAHDDGIRVKPIDHRSSNADARVRPDPSSSSTVISGDGTDYQSASAQQKEPRQRGPATEHSASQTESIIVMGEGDSDGDGTIEGREFCFDTPKNRPSRQKNRRPSRPKPHDDKAHSDDASEDQSSVSSDQSAARTAFDRSEISSSILTSAVGAKSLADIPVGYSAFSELDLSTGSKGVKRFKAQRNPSFRAVPNVFKKVVTGGKKILQDAVEPPKPVVANNPPSIENWLSGTIDPFVEKANVPELAASNRNSRERERVRDVDSHKQRSAETGHPAPRPPVKTELARDEVESVTEITEITETTVLSESTAAPFRSTDTATPVKTPASAGLKRRTATRATSSPFKAANKKPFKEVLKEAFMGESEALKFTPKRYPSYETRPDPSYDSYSDDDYSETQRDRWSSSGSSGSWTRDPPSTLRDERTDHAAGIRRRPPTNGTHELSTIVGSAAGYSTQESDMTSHVSDTTVTQSTALTKESGVSRRRSEKSTSGLKRRLTKHSDLVSMLSLPDDNHVPQVLKQVKSRPSFRGARSRSNSIGVDDLLQEFADDENLYQRELKTLVDGIIPVLLTTVLQGDAQVSSTLFWPYYSKKMIDSLSKAVVTMGVALEKLKNAHRRAPHSDVNRLIKWMQEVVPIYDSYLDAWRLGFQDLIVNLLPAAGRLDDEDSLIGALPRNEDGDVVNENGERVDVAHLLKRPLLRIKLLTRWAKGVHVLLSSYETLALSGDFEILQEKARRRYKEETARLADEDAANTDTTRTRDLRTLAPIESVEIDSTRQVNAKDLFSLNLAHSTGQRLECQVELIHRDNPAKPNDKGDVLIRETGDGRRTWLLFPPAPWSAVSARRGDAKFELLIMIQGSHNGNPWYELLSLVTDDDEQVLDWLDILSTTPVPPQHPAPTQSMDPSPSTSSPVPTDAVVPVGGRLQQASPASPRTRSPDPGAATPAKPPKASRYHSRGTNSPLSQSTSSPQSPTRTREATSTQDFYEDGQKRRSLRESVSVDASSPEKSVSKTTPCRDDGAPPPPIHRTLGSRGPPPPVELPSPHIKRRTSSPLKNEYLPSDHSSVTDGSLTADSETESSEDELESTGIPETELGISIKEAGPNSGRTSAHPDSLLPESECSLTPSNSASQAGLHAPKANTPEGYAKYIASVSYWSDKKGIWKEISADPCSVVVGPGIVEAHVLLANKPKPGVGGDTSDHLKPLIALDLTPLVLLRQSTVVDLEIRSAVQDHCQHKNLGGGNFRFRCPSSSECYDLYMAVHHARLNNQKFIQLENDARFKQFGERPGGGNGGDDNSSSQRRGWFGRKNSYRASTRAPSRSQEGGSVAPSSSISAASFLKRLTGNGNLSFNIARSSVDKQALFGGGSGSNSLYTSGSSSSGNGAFPRSPSVSMYSSARTGGNGQPLSSDNIRIRLHLLATPTKWEDYGNCVLQIRRPPPGWRQELRANHGLEKRITVTTSPRKEQEKARVVLDAVLGSGCFTPMGSRGIICGIWEELRGENGEVGIVPATGGAGGSIKKWCFQCASVAEASWVLRLVHQEVIRG
ncbi:hypothetical protein SODALDRAFT_69157 [Sodiomyces alkalinus F11]|uniref:Glucan 4-alpha-glucosidase n=1 Tax=Sodiomyces alkalinus (strain CBS 110278 / VKM F-3762 / F11) TaxID=1314773 RepID=A0A3N2PMH5_SODAK|nr:hypothetical protein SODALDRAFT_69157 [Sodiomyces alkalinus F11]ROT35536.1 hypothetical protein SODALDRAFT_69157 [Sodiomyces alkalinus F11]